MRLMIFVFGVLFLVGFVSVVSAGCDDRMIAYWQMEGDATDSFGSHGGEGFPAEDSGFVVGKAAYFNGNQKIVISDSGAGAIAGSFAIEFWVQSDESPNSYLLNSGNYRIEWIDDGLGIGYIEVTVNSVTVTSGALTSGTSYHVVLTWHAAAQDLILYVTDKSAGSVGVGVSVYLGNKGTFSSLLEIGEGFVGLIDEVALYGREFSVADVDSHYVASSGGEDYCSIPEGDPTVLDILSEGCVFSDGSVIGLESCSRNGMYYCGGDDSDLYYTLGGHESLPGDEGCSFGESSYSPGEPQCCPSGYLCGDDDGELVCNLRTEECGVNFNKGDCDEAGCFWIDEDCVDNPLDYSCSIYDSEPSCDLDVWNVGAAGMGAEVCGTSFFGDSQVYVILQDSCGCDWTGAECVLGYDVVPNIVGGSDTFRCQKEYTTGDCMSGLQQISWTAGVTEVSGWLGGIDSDVLGGAECVTDGIDRKCGEPIIKVPGFSLFSLIASVGILTLIYAFKQNRKD